MSLIGSKSTFSDFIAALPDRADKADWFQFRDETDPKWIGEYLSAVSNAATLAGRPFGYVVWGVDEATRVATGTGFVPDKVRAGGDPLAAWLRRGLQPNVWFNLHELKAGRERVVVLEVEAARESPTSFDNKRWVRVDGATQLLQQDPALERTLWQDLLHPPGESGAAVVDCVTSDVVELIDIERYLRLAGHRDRRRADQLQRLAADRIVTAQPDGRFTIHRHGALLFARDLTLFPNLAPKAIHLVHFDGSSRLDSVLADQTFPAGYASSFDAVIDATHDCLGARTTSPTAIREMVMNALVHQDLGIRHAGPVVDVFSDRVEVSNPGAPLGDVSRLLDQRPRFRNEELIRLLFQLGMCDRRGSGIDRLVQESELLGCPPPTFESTGSSFVVTLRDGGLFRTLSKSDRMQALYLHASLLFTSGRAMTNASVRKRFGLTAKESTLASRYIRETFSAGLITEAEAVAESHSRQYVPHWASQVPAVEIS